jgi:hypothetical protein
VLTLGWFLAALLAAAWHAWANPGRRLAGRVEAGLTACAAVGFLGAALVAPYGWPAWRVAWEGAALVLAFAVVRQLPAELVERHTLLAALLATAAAVAAHAAFQTATHQGLIPAVSRLHAEVPPPAAPPDDELPSESPTGPPFGTARASFTHPETAQHWLLLAFPAFVLLAWRTPGQARAAFAGLAVLTVLAALRSPAALLVMAGQLVALMALEVTGQRSEAESEAQASGRPRGLLPPMTVGAAALAVAVVALAGDQIVPRPLRDAWEAALAVARDHPVFGVGPGQFARYAARALPADAVALPERPHSFPLTLAAAGGLPALTCFVAAVGLFVGAVRRPAAPPPADAAERKRPCWEFYLGGLAGLTLGFVAQVYDLPAAAGSTPIRALGTVATARTLVWFAAFGVLEYRQWGGRSRRAALLTGLAGVLAFSLVSDGLAWPAAAQAFWVLAALALPGGDRPESAWARSGPGRLVPLVLTAGLLLVFVQQVEWPVVREAGSLRDARLAELGFKYKRQAVENAEEKDKPALRVDAQKYLQTVILTPLEQASRANPADEVPYLERAAWRGVEWELVESKATGVLALTRAREAAALDPQGTAGLRAELRLRLLFAAKATDKRPAQFAAVEKLIVAILERDPTAAARLRFVVADARFAAGDKAAGRAEAEAARKLDAEAPGPLYRLAETQREKVQKWLAEK